ncbi:MAG: TonB-dependent receptor [Candidatus Solibacter usitatus]|nr:TonB-dependent receptor [Candidatus Solibacter usitatus]
MFRSRLRTSVAVWLLACALPAAEFRGVVRFGGLPLPGASVTASRGGQTFTTVTGAQGAFEFPDLADGNWTLQVEMQLFATEKRDVSAGPVEFEMNLLPEDRMANIVAPPVAKPVAAAEPVKRGRKQQPAATNTKGEFQRTDVTAARTAPTTEAAPSEATLAEFSKRAADGLLINGSVNNGALTPFAQLPAFGNHRRGQRSMYNGNLGVILNHAAFDARSFSLTGQDTPKPAYSRVQGLASFGGPIKIPRLIERNGPNVMLNYQWTRNSNANVRTGLMPTAEQRNGVLPGGLIPASQINPQAKALLDLYPLPNFSGNSRYNYQIPLISGMHQDDLQTRIMKQRKKEFFSGSFAWQNTRTDNTNLFGFLDTSRNTGMNSTANWRHGFSPRTLLNFGIQFSRQSMALTPFFANRRNVSGEAGISGGNQDPINWGPPAIVFSSGIDTLNDAPYSRRHNQTISTVMDGYANRGRHNITYGYTHRWQQFNVFSQQDARGTLGFTGGAPLEDFARFLRGAPDTSSIAFGNADKYLRASVNESFANDDFRINPGLTLNYGVRWEYWTPMREKYGRLVNLDIAPGFASATPVIAAQSQAASIRPDRNNISPRLGLSWRPMAASSLVIRAGYGIYYDTSVYQPIAMQMAQQSPLSKSLRVSNTPQTPLTLANGFPAVAASTANTFAVDPAFRIGYAQNWQIAVQRDLPAGLQSTITYAGSKGTRSQQQFLPNTFPAGALHPCALCPSGFTYLASNGNATRNSAQVQLRRRLRSGFTAQVQYTYANSMDNATLGGRGEGAALIAQDWLSLASERAHSNFHQRHLTTGMIQYTSGMGLRGGALANGWQAKLLKEWTFGSTVNAGSGLPLTPVFPAPVRGTGVAGSIRPDYTGTPLYEAPAGFFLNPAAYAAPVSGRWGNAGRNSITGPSQFVLNASLARTFRSTDRISADLRFDASNALNKVTYTSWNAVAGNAQFGLPVSANNMRTMQMTVRVRF